MYTYMYHKLWHVSLGVFVSFAHPKSCLQMFLKLWKGRLHIYIIVFHGLCTNNFKSTTKEEIRIWIICTKSNQSVPRECEGIVSINLIKRKLITISSIFKTIMHLPRSHTRGWVHGVCTWWPTPTSHVPLFNLLFFSSLKARCFGIQITLYIRIRDSHKKLIKKPEIMWEYQCTYINMLIV